MASDFRLRLFSDGQVECWDDALALRVRVVPREVNVPFDSRSPINAVYLLLDDARQVYYVGETTDANRRHGQHVRKFPWWNHAVYFHADAFDSDRLRKFLQDQLFALVRSLQAGVVLVTSLAGFAGRVPSNGQDFWNQMCRCGKALRLLPFGRDTLFPGVIPAEVSVRVGDMNVCPRPPAPWTLDSLAKALVEKHGGGVDGVRQLLTAYQGRRPGSRKWLPIFENAGIVMNPNTGCVADWSHAKNPLP